MRKLSKIGAVLIAVLALTAIAASAAQATESTFGWAKGTTKIDGTADPASLNQVFTVTNEKKESIGSFNCNSVVASAVVSGTGATSVTSTAGTLTYNNSGSADKCPATPFGEAKVTTHNCEYQFTPGLSTGTGTSTGTVDIVNCPATAPIEVEVITAGLCLVKVKEQNGIGPVKYKTVGAEPTTVTAEVAALNFAVTGSGTVCSAAKFGDYTGNVTFEGTNEKGEQTALKVLP